MSSSGLDLLQTGCYLHTQSVELHYIVHCLLFCMVCLRSSIILDSSPVVLLFGFSPHNRPPHGQIHQHAARLECSSVYFIYFLHRRNLMSQRTLREHRSQMVKNTQNQRSLEKPYFNLNIWTSWTDKKNLTSNEPVAKLFFS